MNVLARLATLKYWNKKVLGCICVGIVAYYFNDRRHSPTSELFFYLMCVTFLICTTILLISCLFSWSTGGIISKTIYVSRKWETSNRMRFRNIILFIISYRFHIRVIGRNVKELIYHWVAAILILIASIIMCVVLNDNSRYWHDVYKQLMAAAVSRCDDSSQIHRMINDKLMR